MAKKRSKKKPMGCLAKAGLILGAVVIVPVIIVGALTESSNKSGDSIAGKSNDSVDPGSSHVSEKAQSSRRGPTFGRPVETTVSYTNGSSNQLRITVSPPRTFEPSDPRDIKKGKVAVYFTVTIENIAARGVYTPDVVVTAAITGLGADNPGLDEAAGEGKEGGFIYDSAAGVIGIDGNPDVRPGESLTFKDGFSVSEVSGLTYRIQPAGMAGETLYFQD